MHIKRASCSRNLRTAFLFNKLKVSFVLLLASAMLVCSSQAESSKNKVPPWVTSLPLPQNETLYLVVKGTYSSRGEAESLQKFIQQLMGKYPGDQIDSTDSYEGLPKGQYIVGTLFDSKTRAEWWMDFSYRNRKIAKGTIQEVKLKGSSELPYMPSPYIGGQKRLLTEKEALTKVQGLPDIAKLAKGKKLKYKFTDYPRNGDLRYEIEVLEDRGKKDGLMVDFIMVSALNGDITERLSEALAQKSSR